MAATDLSHQPEMDRGVLLLAKDGEGDFVGRIVDVSN